MAKKHRHISQKGQKPNGNKQEPKKASSIVTNDDNTLKAEAEEEKFLKKVYEIAPEWKVSNIAKRKFMGLPMVFKNDKGKIACIEETLENRKDLIPDQTRFWLWLVDETAKLQRVWDFKETCENAGVEPNNVAQHLILEGKQVCTAIRLEGLAAYGSKIRMFKEPLFEDKFKLFAQKTVSPNE